MNSLFRPGRPILLGLALSLLLSPFAQIDIALGESPRPGVGDESEAVLRILGEPIRKREEAGGKTRWFYGPKSGEAWQLHFRKGRVETIEVESNPPRELARLVEPELLLVELEVEVAGDSRGPERWFAHPASGRIWKVDPMGRVASWSVQTPWKPKLPGKPLAELLSGRGKKGGRK